jgi:hypothetical protein
MAKFSKLREMLKCNQPKMTPSHPVKKAVVKACEDGKEKIIRFGQKGYRHNYSKAAKKSFRARHKCDEPKTKLGAQHWACKTLWPRNKS